MGDMGEGDEARAEGRQRGRGGVIHRAAGSLKAGGSRWGADGRDAAMSCLVDQDLGPAWEEAWAAVVELFDTQDSGGAEHGSACSPPEGLAGHVPSCSHGQAMAMIRSVPWCRSMARASGWWEASAVRKTAEASSRPR